MILLVSSTDLIVLFSALLPLKSVEAIPICSPGYQSTSSIRVIVSPPAGRVVSI